MKLLDDTTKIEECANIIRQIVESKKIKDENEINVCVDELKPAFSFYNFSDEQWSQVSRCVLEQLGHYLDMGVMITAYDHKSWYQARMKDLPMDYTDRNRKYLSTDRGLNKDILYVLDDTTSEILDGFGDPKEMAFSRRGLVMGDVQSGKTNTYVTISCKAADVGYKVIILLTGTIEALRRQTQARMDEGFVGFDSARLLKKKNEKIGVGVYNPDKVVIVYTSTESDFNTKVATQINVPIQSTVDPILFVVKKNKSVLSNLNNWLRTVSDNKQITESALLLIDDEADNASVNTASKDNITAINKEIRSLLEQFQKNTYVGFTATPYANIFIDPEAKDLFPRDFIYCLKSPSNYIGPESLYNPDKEISTNAHMIRIIGEGEEGLPEIPIKHKKEHIIPSIPESLNEALNCFILSCAIRELRGDSKKHMSMLINVSRFTNVQESMGNLINTRLHDIRQSIGSYSKLSIEDALRDKTLRGLWETWSREYQECEFTWNQIQLELDRATRPIQIRTVNKNNSAGSLNYKDTPEGLRLIAIGGNSLSRGLTLEGLCISYFYRNSQSYDTLMQMGRWFGYRDGYKDLCRVWMTERSREWYSDISQATEELKERFEVMKGRGETPEEFGFIIKNDINGLIITDRNKMRTASDTFLITKSINGSALGTDYIFVDQSKASDNLETIKNIISRIEESGIEVWHNKVTDNFIWRSVPKEYVIELLTRFKIPNANMKFDTNGLIEMIEEGGQEVERWDVVVLHGEGKESYSKWSSSVDEQSPIERTGFKLLKGDVLKIERLLAPLYFKEGIYTESGEYDKEKISTLEKNQKDGKKRHSAATYLSAKGRKPILMIFPLAFSNVKNPDDWNVLMDKLGGVIPIALAVGFPYIGLKGEDREKYLVKYKANLVYQKLLDEYADDDDLDEEEIE